MCWLEARKLKDTRITRTSGSYGEDGRIADSLLVSAPRILWEHERKFGPNVAFEVLIVITLGLYDKGTVCEGVDVIGLRRDWGEGAGGRYISTFRTQRRFSSAHRIGLATLC